MAKLPASSIQKLNELAECLELLSSDDERKLEDDGIKRSGKVHVVSKRTNKE